MKLIMMSLIMLLSFTLEAVTTPIFRANFDQMQSPLYAFTMGAGHVNIGTTWEFIPTNDTQVGDIVNINMLPIASGGADQGYYGWSKMDLPVAPQGATRYIRIKMRINSPVNFLDISNSAHWGAKFIILGDGGDGTSRIIWNFGGDNQAATPSQQLMFNASRNIDGAPTVIAARGLPIDQWFYAQLKIVSSSDTSTANGMLYFYIDADNANEAEPTAESTGGTMIDTYAWDNIRLGYYGEYMGTSGHVNYDVAAFEYDDEFDPDWRAYTIAAPNPPDNIQIMQLQ